MGMGLLRREAVSLLLCHTVSDTFLQAFVILICALMISGCFSQSLSVLLQLIFPDLVEGLVLINIDPNGKGWIDWAATKVSRPLPPLMPLPFCDSGGHI